MLSCELIRGLQENGVMACGKHFPGHGDTNLDSHEALPTVPHTIGRLEAVELIPFRAAMDAGVKSMMTAHVMYPSIDKEMPATLSPLIINGLLRRHLGFDGAVFSDDLQMKALSLKWGLGESARLALMAGCDICLICRDTAAQKEAIEHLISSARTGKLPESVVNAAYLRVEKLLKNAR
jgi:beta-N-acetylhexosaminidase